LSARRRRTVGACDSAAPTHNSAVLPFANLPFLHTSPQAMKQRIYKVWTPNSKSKMSFFKTTRKLGSLQLVKIMKGFTAVDLITPEEWHKHYQEGYGRDLVSYISHETAGLVHMLPKDYVFAEGLVEKKEMCMIVSQTSEFQDGPDHGVGSLCKLIGIDENDGIVKMDSNHDIRIIEMERLARVVPFEPYGSDGF
jgi:hypothetical protein